MSTPMPTDEKRRMLQSAEQQVRFYGERITEVQETFDDAKHQLERLNERKVSAQMVLEDLRERFGEEVSTLDEGLYAGLKLQEATLRVIADKRGEAITFDEIMAEFRRNNYAEALELKHPSRSLHAALMRAKGVERVSPATYRWRNGNSPAHSGGG